MKKIFNNPKLRVLFFVIFVFILSYLTFWRALSFDFWGEDWEQIWFAKYQPSMINNVQEMQHPLVIYEELFLVKFFGFNTAYWQLAGLSLKILSAFAVSLMVFGLTKSKKAGFFSGLIYASSIGGLASFTWVAAHSSALEIPLMCLGIYFWVTSYKDIKNMQKGKFLLALILLMSSFLADPARGIFGIFIVIFWEILSIVQQPQILNESKKRIIIMLTSLLSVFLIYQYFVNINNTVSVSYNLGIVLRNPLNSLNNFLNNIGNLLIGWILPIQQTLFAVSEKNIFGSIAGYLFFFQAIYLLKQFINKKNESLKVLLIFSAWIPIFFLPNWLLPNQEMIQNGQILGVTHRYLTLSAVGLVCLLGYFLTLIKNKRLGVFLLIFVIGSNIVMANQILNRESDYRSKDVTKPIWDKIERAVPAGAENLLFFIRGDDKYRVNVISQAKIPFAIRRKIISRDKWPISTSDPGNAKGYICGLFVGERKVPLSNLYGWETKGNTVENISEQIRNEFSKIDCSFQ